MNGKAVSGLIYIFISDNIEVMFLITRYSDPGYVIVGVTVKGGNLMFYTSRKSKYTHHLYEKSVFSICFRCF